MVQQKVHDPTLRLLNGRPKFNRLCSLLIEPTAKLSQAVNVLRHFFLNDFLTVKITHPDLMKLIGPIHSQIKAFQLLCLLGYRFSISGALNGMFALYRSSTKGQLSIEPQLRSLARRDSLPLFLKSGLDESGPHASKLLEIGSTKLSYATSPC